MIFFVTRFKKWIYENFIKGGLTSIVNRQQE